MQIVFAKSLCPSLQVCRICLISIKQLFYHILNMSPCNSYDMYWRVHLTIATLYVKEINYFNNNSSQLIYSCKLVVLRLIINPFSWSKAPVKASIVFELMISWLRLFYFLFLWKISSYFNFGLAYFKFLRMSSCSVVCIHFHKFGIHINPVI